MSDKELWQKYKETSQQKRNKNLDSSKKILIEKNIDFIEKDNGHFIIGNFDFWATTGLFINKQTKKRGRGIFNLLKKI